MIINKYEPEKTLDFIHCQENRYRLFEGFDIADRKRWIVAKHLNDILAGTIQRYELTFLLFGKTSTGDLETGQIRALLDLLEVENFGDIVSEEIQKKIVNLHQHLLSQVNRDFLKKETLEETLYETPM